MPLDFEYLGLDGGTLRPVDYTEAWDHQREVHALVASGGVNPRVIYVQHPSVYTAGHRTLPHERPFDGTPVVDVDRGGKITWHGPGQLVGYPIVTLPERVGVVDFVRRLEDAVLAFLTTVGLESGRVEGRTGVWFPASGGKPERKICAIGVRVARRTTMHGFALNVSPDLAGFGNIVPCGIQDADVTSMERELGSAPGLVEVGRMLEPHLARSLDFSTIVTPIVTPAAPAKGTP